MSKSYDDTNRVLARALALCAAGKSSAFTDIYDLTAPQFTAIISGMVKCEETTRDILQRAYLSIWTNASNYDASKAQPFTWMLVIMRNRALDVLRERKRRGEHEELDEGIIDDESPSPDIQARLQQVGSLLSSQLSVLPARMSQAIMLHVIEGHSCREIGELMGESPNTVKSWIRRGLERIRAELPYQSLDAAI